VRTPRVVGRRPDNRGVTLVELAIASTVLIVLLAGTYATVLRASDSWGSVVTTTGIQHEVRETMRRITEEMKRGANLKIDASNPHADVVSFQIPLAIVDGKVVWGASKTHLTTGKLIRKPGWWVQYRVVNRRRLDGTLDRILVRRVLDGHGLPVGGDEGIAEHVDIARKEKKGFAVTRNANLYAISLRILKIDGRGTNLDLAEMDYRKLNGVNKIQLRSSIQTRNWSTDTGFVTTPNCSYTADDFFTRPDESTSIGGDLIRTDSDDHVIASQ
jgi:hypothetical protein